MRHFISVNQLSKENIISLIETAEKFKQEQYYINQQIFAANLFFEPSTRTKMSFIVAQKKLGLEELDFHSETSSVQKGESLYDTARTFESIGAQLLVVRHPADNWINEINANVNIPIINGGSGKEEHPTQCMLDLLTIYQEFGYFEGLNIVIAGDIKHSRVARSNANALKKLGVNVYLCAAPNFEDNTLDFPYVTMDEAVELCDALMLLRIQHERHKSSSGNTYHYLENFGLTKERERRMKSHAIILHPAPVNRGVEMDTDLVECDRSRIFKQMTNGVYMRMAIIIKLLQEWGILHEHAIEKRQTITA
ncbi:aspartate carbamoyltransferase catalytic subunit [Virgibacillus alimentarius]|uniref:Aspartate carbamoyltransferase n=1 Tax=Virgibacillus alimentarius TaxID=698769 RepID=A0ABS4S6V6_9BACI|nr:MULTISPECIES: aspartate carbamoyltransferase catalytic subunit [Virgibacillus]MBP2256132.1 aspartate carbamoyltransferase catalytic subunit [Virgibacillus alimentarius]HLR66079.1 aspartate carbamoyltransferase catalytic subunit [Virgibacillus sp.]